MLRNHARQVPQASAGAIKPMSGAIVHRHSKCPFLPYDPREASHRGTRAIRAADQDVPARVWLSSPPLWAVARRALLVDFQDSTAIRRLPWGDCSSAGADVQVSALIRPLTVADRPFVERRRRTVATKFNECELSTRCCRSSHFCCTSGFPRKSVVRYGHSRKVICHSLRSGPASISR